MNKKIASEKNANVLQAIQQKRERDKLQLTEQIDKILKSHKRPYEKKIALFNLVKDLELEESPEEQKRVNYLLESCLLNQMAKQSMKEYKKTTVENFSENSKEMRYEKN